MSLDLNPDLIPLDLYPLLTGSPLTGRPTGPTMSGPRYTGRTPRPRASAPTPLGVCLSFLENGIVIAKSQCGRSAGAQALSDRTISNCTVRTTIRAVPVGEAELQQCGDVEPALRFSLWP